MAPDTMQVRLHLRLICVLAVVVDALGEPVVAVCSTPSWSRCPPLRAALSQRARHPASPHPGPVGLGAAGDAVWHRRRFACDGRGERHLEAHDEFEGRLTRRLAGPVVADAVNAKVMSVRAVARRHRLSWAVVMELGAQLG